MLPLKQAQGFGLVGWISFFIFLMGPFPTVDTKRIGFRAQGLGFRAFWVYRARVYKPYRVLLFVFFAVYPEAHTLPLFWDT